MTKPSITDRKTKKIRIKISDDVDVNSLLYGIECQAFEEQWEIIENDAWFRVSRDRNVVVNKKTGKIHLLTDAKTTALGSINIRRKVEDVSFSLKSRTLVFLTSGEYRFSNAQRIGWS